ncbi:MAG: GntR family transcriptional regulator [Cellulomonas sp.]|uniref:GntR family transcriptional regulator n=1 Tax=Cellulomonas sp. TaxID=40001 RepID=UPI0018212269|nr:GntR family transcriptional regulator [Cellulomonas sp.]NMM32088.1 GntR family transcriptional regulator [Cellulomonas sp.]
MNLLLEVDVASSIPVFEQVRLQVVAHVAAGRLTPGDHLPTIRALATDLGVATGTGARAYRVLETAGIVTTRRRAGTTVASGVASADAAGQHAARVYVDTARAAGLSDEAALALVRGALMRPEPGPDAQVSRESPTGSTTQASSRNATNPMTAGAATP